ITFADELLGIEIVPYDKQGSVGAVVINNKHSELAKQVALHSYIIGVNGTVVSDWKHDNIIQLLKYNKEKNNRPLTITFHKPVVSNRLSSAHHSRKPKIVQTRKTIDFNYKHNNNNDSNDNNNNDNNNNDNNNNNNNNDNAMADRHENDHNNVPLLAPDKLFNGLIDEDTPNDWDKCKTQSNLRAMVKDKINTIHRHYAQLYHHCLDMKSFQGLLQDCITEKIQQLSIVCKENLVIMAKLYFCESLVNTLNIDLFHSNYRLQTQTKQLF
ncbi:hypothetical protein RFI_19844, partial [Reticulomyxa filosa]